MNWINFIIYIGMFFIGISFWYVFVYYVMDWLKLW